MADDGSGSGSGAEPASASKPASTMESAGGRIRFRVELWPEETTIVSWKKLLKGANLSESTGSGQLDSGPSDKALQQPVPQAMAPPASLPAGASSSKQPVVNEEKGSQVQTGTNRLSSVIERIERMYAGNGSSDDDEDFILDNVPDDDEYDTEDSFIDDAELDDYFQVDNSAIKHDGFFVNRGKLERIELTAAASQQPKKRRRKDLEKGRGENDERRGTNQMLKIENKGKKTPSLLQRNLTGQSHVEAMVIGHGEHLKCQTSANAPEVSSTNKTADNQTTADHAGLPNGDAISKGTNADQQRPVVPSSKKRKESNNHHTSPLRETDKKLYISKSNSGKQPNNIDYLDLSFQPKEKGRFVERFDLNIPASRVSLPTSNAVQGSTVRPKSPMLEKAIRELEKIVAEIRPPSTEFQDPDNSSQSVKRRLPPEVKQKLAKVARIAQQPNDGKVPKDIITRLMGIVGHLMQVRTLKRNLKVLASTGLSAKQEKDDKIQKMKQEVEEMVKLRIPNIRSKAQQQAENSSDFQEGGPEESKVLKRKFKMDEILENKICDLYDLCFERQEEDSGPPVRRMYEELMSFWPSGLVDTNGIKRAIYRAKNRKASSSLHRDQEKITKKKALPPKAVTQASHSHNKVLPESHDNNRAQTSKPVPSGASVPVTFANDTNADRSKQEKVKESASINPIENPVQKKKMKKKPNAEAAAAEAQLQLGKMVISQPKHHKQVAVPPSKQNLLAVLRQG